MDDPGYCLGLLVVLFSLVLVNLLAEIIPYILFEILLTLLWIVEDSVGVFVPFSSCDSKDRTFTFWRFLVWSEVDVGVLEVSCEDV